MSDSNALDLRARALRAALLAGGLTLGLSLASAGTASAQFVFDDAVLPPRVVAWRLADRGFTGLSRPRFDGRVYVVEAVSPSGLPVRLFVDPAVGAIVGRQPLARVETYARLERPIARPLPGFGWTEEDAAPRAVRPLPAEDVPAARPARRPAAEAVRPPDANPYGVNPDGAVQAPRKVARTNPARQPELKPALRTTPEAPAPKVAPEAAKSESAKSEPTKPEAKPATEGGAAADAPAKPAPVAEAPKPAAQEWKEPPADKRPVRVIGGPTVVPGTADNKEPGAAQ
jgi:hypothetical protein